jgi:hypothetical protein
MQFFIESDEEGGQLSKWSLKRHRQLNFLTFIKIYKILIMQRQVSEFSKNNSHNLLA